MEQLIRADNPVRVIEAYVGGLNMEEMGFLTASALRASWKRNARAMWRWVIRFRPQWTMSIKLVVHNEVTNENDIKAKYGRMIVEHPYGTVKRQWGFTYTLLKTIPKVQAETDLIFTCYNLTRCLNILGVKALLERI